MIRRSCSVFSIRAGDSPHLQPTGTYMASRPHRARNNVGSMRDDVRADFRELLASQRARITPEQASLPAYGGYRRVFGLTLIPSL